MKRLPTVAASIIRLQLRVRSLLARYQYIAAAGDQVALSLFNFALSFLLLRVLSATEFGVVSVWMAAALLARDVQGALVGAPLSVHVPGAADAATAGHLENAIATVNFMVITAVVAVVAGIDAVSQAEWAPIDLATAFAIPLFVGAGMSREYYRTLSFSRRDMAMLLLTDIPYLVVTATCLLAMVLWRYRLAGVATAFVAMSLGCFAGQLCVWPRLAPRRPRLFRRGWTTAYQGIVGEVGWVLAGAASAHVQLRGYVYITTSLVGLAELAAINVVGLLFRPARLLLDAWGRSALPHLSALLARGDIDEFDRAVMRGLAGATFCSLSWCVFVWLAWQPIAHYVLADKYPEAKLLLLPWAVATTINAVEFIFTYALLAAREFRFLACVTFFLAPLTAVATVGMILWQGYTATIWGLAIGNVVGLLLEAGGLYRVRRRAVARIADVANSPVQIS